MPHKILVVEDDVIIAADLRETLERLGYEAGKPAATSDDVLRRLESDAPDLVLMDIQIRGPVDGIDTVKRLRRVSDVSVVYLTSHSDDATIHRAKETAPHGYIIKPFNERELRTAIEVALHKHQLERHLAVRERWFSTTLDSLGDAIIATDSAERITYMNPVAEKLTGHATAEAKGRDLRTIFRLVDDAGAPIESPVGQAIRTQFAVALPPQTNLVDKAGGRRVVEDAATPIIDDRGQLLGGVIVFRDVTEQRRLERRLAISERMASVGTMAAGIAHEINNPLASIVGNLEISLELLADARAARDGTGRVSESTLDELDQTLRDAAASAERVRKIVHAMRGFARAPGGDAEILDLPDVLETALRLTENTLRHRARVVRAYGTTPFVQCAETQLVQVLTNLLTNAGDAVPEGDARRNEVRVSTFTSDDGSAVVEVRDSGVGIAPSNLGRIFDPFFTTKAVGKGMGLGLSLSHSFVTSVGGTLTAASELGHGSSFRVTLPAARPAPRASASREAPLPPIRDARILVIDDDGAVANVVKRALSRHRVAVELDGAVAVGRIVAGEAFDLVLCDVMMPNVSGIDVYEAVKAQAPRLAATMVFLTGGAFSPAASAFLESVPNPVVRKPFTAAGLRDVVDAALREAAPKEGSA